MMSCPTCRTKFDPTFTLHCPACGRPADPGAASSAAPDVSSEVADPVMPPPRPRRRFARLGRALAVRAVVAAAVLMGSVAWSLITDGGESEAIPVPVELEARPEGYVAVSDLATGDCVMWPTEEDEFYGLVRLPCTESHDAEMYAVLDYPATEEEEYLGSDPISDWSVQACFEEFAGYVGTAYEDAEHLEFTFFAPTEASWRKFDDRVVQCLIFRVDETALTGSVRS